MISNFTLFSVKNRSFGQKSKFPSKIKIVIKHGSFGQKSKFWSKIGMLVKNRNFVQKLKFWSKIEILVKNRNFAQKSKFFSKNRNAVHKSKFCQKKIQLLVKSPNFSKNLNVREIFFFQKVPKKVDFGKNFLVHVFVKVG